MSNGQLLGVGAFPTLLREEDEVPGIGAVIEAWTNACRRRGDTHASLTSTLFHA